MTRHSPGSGACGTGAEIHALIRELYPICRSITGEGLRESLRILQRHIPLELAEVATGTRVFDWTIPREWNIRDAYIKDGSGARIVDFRRCNLHVVNYSAPISAVLPLHELRGHLHTLPEHPDWVPYRTSYYREDWGFCLAHRQLLQLADGDYEVHIDSSLHDGSLTLGELYLPGELEEEVLLSCHVCHPSLANDNLSGVALATFLARRVMSGPRRYSYRFLFVPGTIGAIAWLALHEKDAGRIRHGLVLSGLGDAGAHTYKRSRRGNAEIDRAVALALKESGLPHTICDYAPYGYDERQYCSPGFNLPVGCLSRSPYGRYPEYHTSADDLGFVQPEHLEASLAVLAAVVDILEHDGVYLNRYPKCEPQLGARGLYGEGAAGIMPLLWVLNLSDGHHSLLDIAERAGVPHGAVAAAAALLERAGLLEKVLQPPVRTAITERGMV